MRFLYRGILSDGRSVSGELEAHDRKQALHVLIKRGIHILKLDESSAFRQGKFFLRYRARRNIRMSLEEMVHFFEKLFRLLSAKLTLSEAISSMIRNSSNTNEKELLGNILHELQDGSNLADALNKFCNSLPNNVLCILSVGDVTGDLPHALENVIKILRRKLDLKKHMIAALSYPVLICLVSICVIVLFMLYLVPNVERMMRNLGGQLPASTRFLITCSHMIVRDSWLVLLILIGCFTIYRVLRRREDVRLWMDRVVLKIPVIGALRMLCLRVNIINMLAGLLSSGIDLARALKIPVDSLDNSFFKKQYMSAQAAIMDGGSVADVLQKFGIIDGPIADIIAVGEKTGRLDIAFTNASDIYEDRLDNFLKKLVVSTSSIALICAFSLVAILALSIVSSVLNFSTSLSH